MDPANSAYQGLPGAKVTTEPFLLHVNLWSFVFSVWTNRIPILPMSLIMARVMLGDFKFMHHDDGGIYSIIIAS